MKNERKVKHKQYIISEPFLVLKRKYRQNKKKVGVSLEGRRKRAERNQTKNTQRKVIIGLLSVLLACGVGVFGYFLYQRHLVKELLASENIYQGISVEGISMAGLTKEQALAQLQEKYKTEMDNQTLTFQYEEEKWTVPFTEVDAGYHLEEAVEQAYNTGRVGTEKECFRTGKILLKEGIDVTLEYSYDKEKMSQKLNDIAGEFNREAVDSTVSRKSGGFVVTPEQTGRSIKIEEAEQKAAAILDTRTSGVVQIAAETVQPKITAEANSHVTDLIGSYSTTYNNSDPNRNTNLAVGSKYINGTMVAPGEVFSANAELGSQTYEGGYKDAAIYNNGKVEKGVAGGVCQVTTTLYNAVLMAELEIVERHPHSMTVGYVPLGRDAAVAGTYKDLKFKNNTEYPILVEAYASNGNLVMNIYGQESHQSGRKVEYETVYEATIPKPEEVVEQDPNRPEGEKVVTARGRTGAKVSVYKVVYENGKQVSKDWFSSSSYRAAPDYVTVGTKKPEQKQAPAEAKEQKTEKKLTN